MKIFTITLIAMLLHFAASTQPGLIKWDKHVNLLWSDFKGKVDPHSPFAAMSAIGIHYKYNSWSNGKRYKVKFEIYAIFDKSKSWSNRRLRSAAMLTHEQLHFDIGALVSNEFKKEAESRTYSKNYKNQINAMFYKYSNTLQKFQQKYDLQTAHGNDKKRQKEWENLVHQELAR